MGRDLNQVTVTGRLTNEPEMRILQNGTKLTKFRMAIDDSYQDSAGTKHDRAVFVDVSMWGERAQAAKNFLHKGMRIGLSAELEFSQWTQARPDTGEEEQRSKVSLRGRDFKFMEAKKEGGNSKPSKQEEEQEPVSSVDATDDDIPF